MDLAVLARDLELAFASALGHAVGVTPLFGLFTKGLFQPGEGLFFLRRQSSFASFPFESEDFEELATWEL